MFFQNFIKTNRSFDFNLGEAAASHGHLDPSWVHEGLRVNLGWPDEQRRQIVQEKFGKYFGYLARCEILENLLYNYEP